ncbi:MAG: RHS repeat-associated core domain-containing protein [Verrucomicrobiaceae bacterium]|nr:MAG: RHS repeat-associated core domain-containing protein [Verrucomicrobiaceae bacterium]
MYDAQGRRTQKTRTVKFADDKVRVETSSVLWSGWLPLLEIRKRDGVEISRHWFQWGRDLSGSLDGAGGIGGLLAIIEEKPSQSPRTLLPVQDGLGNITAVFDAANGALVARYDYGPFGEPLGESGDVDACPFRYQTKWYDKESEYYNFGYRYYSPRLGTWLSRDPLGEEGGFNLYAYCGNDPVNSHDPLGLDSSQDNSGGNPGLMIYTNNWDTYSRYIGSQRDFGQLKHALITFVDSNSANNAYLATDLLPGVPLFNGTGYPHRVTINPSESWYYYGAEDARLKAEERALIATFAAYTPKLMGFSPTAAAPLMKTSSAVTRTLRVVEAAAVKSRGGPVIDMVPDAAGTLVPIFERQVLTLAGRTSSSPGISMVLHRDQIIMNNYQRYYNDAWSRVVPIFNSGEITIPCGLNWKTVLGQKVDKAARERLLNYLRRERIPEGPGTDVLVNRWLRDPAGSGAYRIPDLRLIQTRKILDGTIGEKTLTMPQAVDFYNFSGGFDIFFVKPTIGPIP